MGKPAQQRWGPFPRASSKVSLRDECENMDKSVCEVVHVSIGGAVEYRGAHTWGHSAPSREVEWVAWGFRVITLSTFS